MDLNIKRVAASKSKCCFPKCQMYNNLREIKEYVRAYIIKKEKIYIPPNAKTCSLHSFPSNWLDIEKRIPNKDFVYTKSYMKDIFQMLITPTKQEIMRK